MFDIEYYARKPVLGLNYVELRLSEAAGMKKMRRKN